jgi:hypothetical protein
MWLCLKLDLCSVYAQVNQKFLSLKLHKRSQLCSQLSLCVISYLNISQLLVLLNF